MPFIPHTEKDLTQMLQTIGVESIETLFEEIPASLRIQELSEIPEGINEMSLKRLMQEQAAIDTCGLNFIGAGAYEHHIPAAVWEIASRGEWMTAYTPYQAEASQGTLQLLYEYQSMMANLMSMEVSNASLYDGASALAEAVLMAVRIHPKSNTRRVLLPTTVNPFYRAVVKTIVQAQNIEIIEIPYDPKTGTVSISALNKYIEEEIKNNKNNENNEKREKNKNNDHQDTETNITALVIPQPNFFGQLEAVDELTDWAKKRGACTIAVVNPISMALLKPPGLWGSITNNIGVDIACGEGQSLGVPLASGGPYFGFLSCKKDHIRQLPGRLIGRTVDTEGKEGFTLTLQAREQHIRRSKATSNICTNQGLLVTAATLYMSLLGFEGLRRVAIKSHQNTQKLAELISKIPGVQMHFQGPYFHELVIRLSIEGATPNTVIEKLAKQSIQAGFSLSEGGYSELNNCLLICATETKTEEDLNIFAKQLADSLK